MLYRTLLCLALALASAVPHGLHNHKRELRSVSRDRLVKELQAANPSATTAACAACVAAEEALTGALDAHTITIATAESMATALANAEEAHGNEVTILGTMA